MIWLWKDNLIFILILIHIIYIDLYTLIFIMMMVNFGFIHLRLIIILHLVLYFSVKSLNIFFEVFIYYFLRCYYSINIHWIFISNWDFALCIWNIIFIFILILIARICRNHSECGLWWILFSKRLFNLAIRIWGNFLYFIV